MKRGRRSGGALTVLLLLWGCGTGPIRSTPAPPEAVPFGKINHFVVIILENRSFDNLYALFPGADGLKEALKAPPQVDAFGTPFATLPRPVDNRTGAVDARFPPGLPNKPFLIDQYIPIDDETGSLVHRFYQEQTQIAAGRMDAFATVSDAKGLALGYHDTSKLPLATEAREYTLADRFFHGAFGGSFLNHMWLICSCAPQFPGAPAELVATVDDKGIMQRDGAVTPDGFAVNTLYTGNSPRKRSVASSNFLPNQTAPTIGDRLSEAAISWAWYAGGWTDALAGRPDEFFQYHHQPFTYFEAYGDGKPAKAEHLRDEAEFFTVAAQGTLPAVSFVKPLGTLTEHPGYADLLDGERHTMKLIDAVRNGPNWKDTAIIVTYDENGGYWDHVAPPRVDRWGPGARVPTLIISPYARRGFIDHTTYDTTSILSTIEARFGLRPLAERDAKAPDLRAAFDFQGAG